MSNAYAALGSAIIPVMLMVMSAIVVFVQSYQVTPQWKCYDDIYVGRYNIKGKQQTVFFHTAICCEIEDSHIKRN